MGGQGRLAGGYDAAGDAERLAAPMRKWARIGFMRGFSGIRGEVLPKGKMKLPSAAFHEAASKDIPEGATDDENLARIAYVEAVEARLREVQAKAINDHFRKAALGQAADVAVGLLFLGLGIGLIVRVGPYHPVTLVLIGLFAVKLLFMHLSVRRLLRIAQAAFKTQADDIVMPWSGRN